jgi:hypothetical protein
MRVTERMFWILAAFFVAADIVYVVWNLIFEAQNITQDPNGGENSSIEWVGTVALTLSAICAVLIAFFVRRTIASQGGQLPADRPDAGVDDDDPEQGFFSPFSWWPVMLSLSVAVVFTGMAVGFWVVAIGAAGAIICIVGFAFEYYRGFFAR